MIWTYLRSCYGFDMRVWIGEEEKVYPARWYFCDPDAAYFPSPHGAEASPWLKQYETNAEWGDDGSVKKLDRGINPGYPGQCSIGNPQWFIDGRLPANILEGPLPPVPDCCGYLPPPSTDPRCPPVPGVPAYFCQSGYAPSAFHILADLGNGVYSHLNGEFSLAYVTTLFWEASLLPGYWALYHLGSVMVLEGSADGGPFSTWRYVMPAKFDCQNPKVFLPSPGFQPGKGNPPQILFLPNN